MVLCIVNLFMNMLLVFMVMRSNPAGAISLYTLRIAPIIFVVVMLMNVVFLVMIYVIYTNFSLVMMKMFMPIMQMLMIMVEVMFLPITDKPSSPLLPLPLLLEKCLGLVHLFQHFMVVSFVRSIVVFSMMAFSMVVISMVMTHMATITAMTENTY